MVLILKEKGWNYLPIWNDLASLLKGKERVFVHHHHLLPLLGVSFTIDIHSIHIDMQLHFTAIIVLIDSWENVGKTIILVESNLIAVFCFFTTSLFHMDD